MRRAPLISIVVPCYNYGRFLPDCLTSIFEQQGVDDFEVIAIDDASEDDTIDVLGSFRDSRLRITRHLRNEGHVYTVNEGLTQALGNFIARIDPDDRYRPHFLTAALAKFREFPALGLVYGDAALIDEDGHITAETSDTVHGGRDFLGNEFIALLLKNFICAPTALARREAWHKALPVPSGLAFNDWYFNLMMGREYDFYYIHRVLADYRVHASNHHARIVMDKSEEPSILRVLDRIYAEVETRAELETAKRRARGRVFSAQYLTLAEKYFGLSLNADARRCYWSAVRFQPSCLLNFGIQRRFLATILGRTHYEFGKMLLKSVGAVTRAASRNAVLM
jgi:glycosyltransferase involved in cell wall biosynthesis